MREYILIIGGGILQIPLVEEAQKMNFNVIVSDWDAECACRELADRFWEIDVFDSTEHVEHARILLKQESIQIVGCIAAGIDATETAWHVNTWIQLKTKGKHGYWISLAATEICRDKYKFRQWQEEHGFNHPKYLLAGTGVRHFNDCIVKPIDNSGGRGNTKIILPSDVRNYLGALDYAISQSKKGKGSENAIIEELLSGKEYTVETIWENGKMYPAFITDRYFKNNDKYAIEAGASHPSSLSTERQSELYSEMERLGNSLGMKYGPLKGDIMIVEEKCSECEGSGRGILNVHNRDRSITKVTMIYDLPNTDMKCKSCKGTGKDNKIYILETTTRYSGGFDCQYLVPLATGKNILRAAIQSNVYGKFYKGLLKAKWDKHTMIGSPWPREGVMKGYDLSLPLTEGDYKAFYIAKKGDKIKYIDSTSRVAFLIVTADSRIQAIERMKKGLENLRVEVE